MKNDITPTAPYTATINTLPASRIEILARISWDHVETFDAPAFKKLAEGVVLDGFRKGNVPPEVARKHIPDEILVADMAELAINSVYPSILVDHTLDIIGRPEVTLTKVARNNPLEFTIRAAIVPVITLPDYTMIGKDVPLDEPASVTDLDVEKVIDELRQMRAYGHTHAEGDVHDHADQPLPDADDAFAQSFGKFTTIVEFRAKIKENLMLEAEHATHDKRRIAIMERIVSDTSFEVPEIILASENEKMLATIEADVARTGATLTEYLTHINKTREEMLEEFKPEAEKRARFQLVLNAIARKENVLPTEAEVEVEAQKYLAMYPGADLNRTKAYADMMLTNEKVLALLEGKN